MRCKFCGAVDTAGYTFDSSIAVVNDKFVGLPLDEVNEDGQTDERISDRRIECITGCVHRSTEFAAHGLNK